MAAVYVVVVLLAGVLLSRARWSNGGRRSMSQYHRALDVLGELSERSHPRRGTAPDASMPSEPPSVPPSSRPERPFGGKPTRPAPAEQPTGPALVFGEDERPDGRSFDAPGTRAGSRRALHPPARVGALGIALAALGTALGLAVSRPSQPASVAARPTARRPVSSPRTTALRPSSLPTTSTTSTTIPLPDSGPVIGSVSPAEVAPGQSLTVSGHGFTSPNGVIVATFDTRPAPTHCPTEEKCVATVPSGLSGTVTVWLQAGGATSNGAHLRYAR